MPYAEFSVHRIYSGMTEGTVYVPAKYGKGLDPNRRYRNIFFVGRRDGGFIVTNTDVVTALRKSGFVPAGTTSRDWDVYTYDRAGSPYDLGVEPTGTLDDDSSMLDKDFAGLILRFDRIIIKSIENPLSSLSDGETIGLVAAGVTAVGVIGYFIWKSQSAPTLSTTTTTSTQSTTDQVPPFVPSDVSQPITTVPPGQTSSATYAPGTDPFNANNAPISVSSQPIGG